MTLAYDDQTLELSPYTYCHGSVCADGMPPDVPPDVGSPDGVVIRFPLEAWSFSATFRPAGEECGREQTVPVETGSDGELVLRPAGHAGTYDVTLFGRGDGDLFTTFRWTTPHAGPLPEPSARLAVLADHDGEVDSYGVELMIGNLARTPDEASATITVRDAEGGSVTFDATRVEGSCWPEGTVYWDGPREQGQAAAALGEGPFTYEVDLLLDGVRHVGTATWPGDVIEDLEPSVALEFTPPLPGLE